MPELPEVEMVLRHLAPLLKGRRILNCKFGKARPLRPETPESFSNQLAGCSIAQVERRGKALIFTLHNPRLAAPLLLLGHLGMTGRMYVQPNSAPLPKHLVAAIDVGGEYFVFEDARGFGRFTTDTRFLDTLGPEPLGPQFTENYFVAVLKESRAPIKSRLLDQSVVAGIGNIYASEALFHARIHPSTPAGRLARDQAGALRRAVRDVLRRAIRLGDSMELDFTGKDSSAREAVFYFGEKSNSASEAVERFAVYDRAGEPCPNCGAAIQRERHGGRSTFFCATCQGKTRRAVQK